MTERLTRPFSGEQVLGSEEESFSSANSILVHDHLAHPTLDGCLALNSKLYMGNIPTEG